MPADQSQVGDTVVIIVVLAALAIGLISVAIGHVIEAWDRLRAWWREGFEREYQRRYVNTAAYVENEPEPPRSPGIPHMNAPEPRSSGSSEPFVLALNADELAAVARMIEHNKTAAKPSKSSAIQAGFGVSRGGSQLYQRASAIYDALFGQPDPAVETPVAGRRTHARFSNQPPPR